MKRVSTLEYLQKGECEDDAAKTLIAYIGMS